MTLTYLHLDRNISMRHTCMPSIKSLTVKVADLKPIMCACCLILSKYADLAGWPWPWYATTEYEWLDDIHMHARYQVCICNGLKIIGNCKILYIWPLTLKDDLDLDILHMNMQIWMSHHSKYQSSICNGCKVIANNGSLQVNINCRPRHWKMTLTLLCCTWMWVTQSDTHACQVSSLYL